MLTESGLINPQYLSEIRRLELRSRRSVNSDLMGNYRSAFKGTGLAFSDLREYQPGDDVKHIHWKVTARTGKVFVKSFEEDRQLRVMLAVDISRSTAMGSVRSKSARALEFAALVTILATKNSDSVGLALFSDQIHELLPPKHSRTQAQRILLSLLAARQLKPKTNLKSVLKSLAERQRKSCILFLISDFFAPDYDDELRLLSSAHDVVCVSLEDPLDQHLPKAGLVEFEDAETGERRIVDTSSPTVQRALLAQSQERRALLQKNCQRLGADFMCIQDQPLKPLLALMQRRTHRFR